MDIRLDKYIADTTKFTRKDAKSAIRAGRVQIDGVTVKKDSTKVAEGAEVLLDGHLLRRQEYVYLMMNKPAGVVSATKDRDDATVLSLLNEPVPGHPDLFPVGRLDKDTEGLLLLTDDGDLAHRLLSPQKHVEKTYYLQYEGELLDESESLVEKGLDIGEKHLTKPGVLKRAKDGVAYLTISEGKYHQVKRMIRVLGGKVTYLKRMSMGTLHLDANLQPGEYRFLTEEEIQRLGGTHG
ncbi:MAG: pseudouridine synthase [Eubacterium sp.]|nr:pseudouridine synthase [Eubacterium sp.]